MISLGRVGEKRPAAWKRDVDLGDDVGVTGEVITSPVTRSSVPGPLWSTGQRPDLGLEAIPSPVRRQGPA